MPLQSLPVAKNKNQFFSAYSLALLLPTLEDADEYKMDATVQALFGRLSFKVSSQLVSDLQTCTTTSSLPSLENIINTKLRPKLAEYILLKQAAYMSLFESQEALVIATNAIREGRSSFPELESAAIAHMTHTSLRIYADIQCTDKLSTRYRPINEDPLPREVCLALSGSTYRYLLDDAFLSDKDKVRLTNEAATMLAVRKLCLQYMQHLRNNNYKLDIADKLYRAWSPKDILSILNQPSNHSPIPLSQAEMLRKNRTAWWLWLFKGLLIITTFPISVPALMLWSWNTRQTINFLKTTGSIFVENILKLSSNHPIAPNNTQLALYAPIQPATPRSTIRMFNSTHDVAAPDHNSPPDAGAEFSTATSILSANMSGFFRRMIEVSLQRETGTPVLISYRINPPTPTQPDQFSIDTKTIFRWTNHPIVHVQIPFFRAHTFALPDDYHQTQRHLPVALQKRRPSTDIIDKLTNCVDSIYTFFQRELSFEMLLVRMQQTEGIHIKEDLGNRAYQCARNDAQCIFALEALINATEEFNIYIRKSLSNHNDAETRDRQAPYVEKIKQYLSCLPVNYHKITPNALAIDSTFQQIYALLEAQKADEAWALYKSMPKLSPFIEHAFPNLKAMKHQLSAIFVMTRHDTVNGSVFLLAEFDVIAIALIRLNRMKDAVGLYNTPQQQRIEAETIAPFKHLNAIGQRAEQQTSNEERCAIRDRQVQENRRQSALGGSATYRRPYDEASSITEITDPGPSS